MQTMNNIWKNIAEEEEEENRRRSDAVEADADTNNSIGVVLAAKLCNEFQAARQSLEGKGTTKPKGNFATQAKFAESFVGPMLSSQNSYFRQHFQASSRDQQRLLKAPLHMSRIANPGEIGYLGLFLTHDYVNNIN